MRLIIGIGGFKRSGKDTFARLLREEWESKGSASASIAFADALRQTASAAYGVPVAEFTDDALKDTVHHDWGITRRDMLLGAGVPATLLPPKREDHWVYRWQRGVEMIPLTWEFGDDDVPVKRKLDMLIVAPDIRRLNEAAAVRQLGGVNVLIRRSVCGWNGHEIERLPHDHEGLSATMQSPWDYVVNNDGDFDHLRVEARRVLESIRRTV